MLLKSNPFYQPPRQWQIRIHAHRSHIPAIDEAFGDIALAISSFEVVEDNEEWYMDVITDISPEEAGIEARIALFSGMLGIETPRCEISELQPRDWISEVERNFPPLNIGRFYVYGSHVKDKPPLAKMALQVNAGAAFGSGEHATTSGCLLALGELAKRFRFKKPLDMGCGSGILALAMAKLWHAPVEGVDIDPVSIRVAKDNARKNGLQTLTRFATGDGYRCPLLLGKQYDIITANILARPLVAMAPLLARHLSQQGVAVLSGLLVGQENMVLAAHRSQGLTLRLRIRQNGWSALVLSY